jgi:hypothetical protein
MKKALALARLDFRRLGFGLLAAGLIAGLLPPFASGLGVFLQEDAVLLVVLAIAGSVSGVRFGVDFLEGRGSFFFARPLPSWVLFAARFMTMLGLAVMAYAALMASNWLASSEREAWRLWPVQGFHGEMLVASWAVSFFFGVAVASHSPARPGEGLVPAWILIPLRLTIGLGAAVVIFGLFADLVMRAYRGQLPARMFFGSWIAAAFVAGSAAVVLGRTERLRMAKVLHVVLFTHLAVSSFVLAGIWTYVLRPGPNAIEAVRRAEASPDGRSAFLIARVDRGDPDHFFPSFLLDLETKKVDGLPSEPFHGPWWSRDGKVMVWNQASLVFLSQVYNLMKGATTFRFRIGDGPVEDVPMPSPTKSRVADRLDIFHLQIGRIIPSSDGDLFAIQTKRGFAFVSKSRGPLSEFVVDPRAVTLIEAILMPTNQLRVAMTRREGAGLMLEFADIDPSTSKAVVLKASATTPQVQVQFDRESERALVSVGPGLQRDEIALVNLTKGGATNAPVTLLSKATVPDVMFLSDGRVLATERSAQGVLLRLFSAEGVSLLNTPFAGGDKVRLGIEMFPGVIAANTLTPGGWELALVDVATGAALRQLPNSSTPLDLRWVRRAPIPGTPGARLFRSRDGAIYELPSPTAEPRLLFPRS